MEQRKTNVDEKGNLRDYMAAQPMVMACEVIGCTSTEGNDYKRKKAAKGWEDEPIFLCDEHSEGYTLIK